MYKKTIRFTAFQFLIITSVSLGFFTHNAQATEEKNKDIHYGHVKKSHGAHVHGHATLNIIFQSDTKGMISLLAPADAFYGFEHQAKTPDEMQKFIQINQSFTALKEKLFTFPADSKCTLSDASVSQKMDDEGNDEHAHKGKKNKKSGTHSELEIEYAFECQSTPLGKDLQVSIGTEFKKLKKIETQVVTAKKQWALTLKKPLEKIKLTE